ncbi:hypothetical protein SCHPADRAFT_877470 [Schizopora paradoxa]|uniref:BTB domain-containing protein n=1 Tax=Schizopora paradoxa TaxID=27342 RepID=A0A0H2RNH2_9AGAM|nr:hypothetical protein SCHPADRAFT_877470 [Schizopora paradoxa]
MDDDVRRAPRPHDILWFQDGNVILKTESFLFRVHKGVLSSLSSVFRDMFEVASVELGENEDSWQVEMMQDPNEELPLVSLVPDRGEDVAHLLRAVYERRYYMSSKDNQPFDKIAALLLLSTKYKFKDIRRDVIEHLLRLYPTTLAKFDTVHDEDILFYRMPRWGCHFKLLKIARMAGADALLPALYYSCADFDAATILQNVGKSLDDSSLKTLLEGRELLAKEIRGIMWIYLAMSESCILHHFIPDGFTSSDLQFENPHPSSVFDTTDLQDVSGRKLGDRWPNRICQTCKPALREQVDKERERIWESLPSYFGLPGWDALRKGQKD